MSIFTKTRNACTRIFRDPLILRVYSTQGDFIKSMHADVEIPKANMVEYVMKDFGKWHNKIATECAITAKKYTFEELWSNSVNLSKSLRKVFKLTKGDVVAVFLPNNPDYPICVFGTILAGLTVTTINPTYTVDELDRHLKDSNAKAIITFGSYWGTVQQAVNKLRTPIPIVIIKYQVNTEQKKMLSISDYARGLSKENKSLYIEKVQMLGGQDPYAIDIKSFTLSLDNVPRVTLAEITEFLIFRVSSHTQKEIRAYKSLDAFARLASRWIQDIRAKEINDHFCVLGKPGESIPEGAVNYDELLNMKTDLPDIVPVESDDVIFLPYSSGTTGLPKGVMLTNNNLVSNVAQNRAPEIQYAIETTDTYQDVLPLIIPMYHIYGFTVSTMSLLSTGCKIVTIPKFSPEVYLGTIARCKPTILHLVPPLVVFLNTYPGVKVEYFESLRSILCGAAPLGALDEEKFRKTVAKPFQILQGYGMTETSPLAFQTPQKYEGKHPGTFGHPISNTFTKIVNPDDPTLKHLGPNESGELLIKGPQVMKGYHNKPEETKETFTDGWYRTGDIAKYDKDQMFYITDRIKELIKVKGYQVAPAELEEIIRGFPGVSEAAVIGIPHEYLGESPRAYIVEQSGKKIDLEKLADYVNSKVARHKKLVGGVAVVDRIPKNASGKILRKQLRSQYETSGI